MTLEDVYIDLQELGIEALDNSEALDKSIFVKYDRTPVESGSTSELLVLERDLFLRVMIQTQSGKVFGFNVCSDTIVRTDFISQETSLISYLWPKDIHTLCNELNSSKQFSYGRLRETMILVGTVMTEFDVCEWPLVLQIVRRMKHG